MEAKGNTSQTVLTPDKRSLIIRGETLRTGPRLLLRALKGNRLEVGQTLESHKTRFLQVENNLEVLVIKRKIEKKQWKLRVLPKFENNYKIRRYTNIFSKGQKKALLILETVLSETDRKKLSSAKTFCKPHKSLHVYVIAGPEKHNIFHSNQKMAIKANIRRK